MLVELQMAPLRNAVHLHRDSFVPMLLHGKSFADFPHLEQAANTMLDELLWWTQALHARRVRDPAA